MKQKLLLNQRLKLIWLLLVPLLLAGCKRLDGNTVVEGQVVDRHTGEPVANATVTVYSGKSSSSSGSLNVAEFDEQADGNGNFSFSFEADGSKTYAVRAFKESGYFTVWEDAIYLEKDRNNKKLKLKMQAPAWVRVNLVNVLPLNTISSIYIGGFNYDSNGSEGEYFYNLSNDTSFIRGVLGNQERSVIWRINIQGNETRTIETVFCPAMDTTEVTIEY